MSEELDSTIKHAKDKGHKPHSFVLGLGIAIVSMLAILSLLVVNQTSSTKNLTEVLNKRAPFLEYTACFNDRLIANNHAFKEFVALYVKPTPDTPDPEPALILRRVNEYNEADRLLTAANDLDSPDRCPSLELVKPRK